jgi:hypothetical protein
MASPLRVEKVVSRVARGEQTTENVVEPAPAATA